MSEYHPLAIEAVAAAIEAGEADSTWAIGVRSGTPDALDLWKEDLALADRAVQMVLNSEPLSVLQDACAKAAEQYRFYEREHAAKADQFPIGSAEALDRHKKAEANGDYAEMCEGALAGRRSTLIEAPAA